jgi:hypothetical protein
MLRRVFLCCLFSVGALGLSHAVQPDFGPNVTVFDPSMPASTVQAAVDAVSQVQALPSSQFNTVRQAFLFKPGSYNVDVQVAYYTSVAGLGLSPDDVTINGEVRVEGQVQPDGSVSALVNFWRSAENLSVNPIAPLTMVARRSTSGQCRKLLRCAGSTSAARYFCSPTKAGSPAAVSLRTRWSTESATQVSTVSSSGPENADRLVEIVDAGGQDQMLAASQCIINFVHVISRLRDEEVGDRDRRTGCGSVSPSNSRGISL